MSNDFSNGITCHRSLRIKVWKEQTSISIPGNQGVKVGNQGTGQGIPDIGDRWTLDFVGSEPFFGIPKSQLRKEAQKMGDARNCLIAYTLWQWSTSLLKATFMTN